MSVACSDDAPPVPARPESASCDPLKEFDSFRYTFIYKIESPEPTGEVDVTAVGTPPFAVAPDSPSVTLEQTFDGSYRKPDNYRVTINTAGQGDTPPIELLFAGGNSYADLGGGQWQLTEAPNAFPPITVCQAVLGGEAPLAHLDLSGLDGTQEEVAGEDTTHFRKEGARVDAIAVLLGAESDMARLVPTPDVDVWLAEDGWPARLEVKGSGLYPSGREMLVEFSLELKDINADDINIEVPQ